MKRGCVFLVVLFILLVSSLALAQDDLYEEEFSSIAEEDIYEDIGDVQLEGSAGLTPDSTFYFLENAIESILVGDNPETALQYKEEKILEAKEMIESGNQEAAGKALSRAGKYNDIIKKEVSPDIEKKVRSSSKAVKATLQSIGKKISGDEWEDLRKEIDENVKTEDKIALAAKISSKIGELCKALSDLDPLEYSNVCKTDDSSPKWKIDLDQELTKEQEKEAKEFFAIMSECFQNPSQCRCDDISIKPFAEKCNVIAPLAAKCEAGDKESCEEMENVEDPIDLLPDYLQDVLDDAEDEYGDSKHDLHIPRECVEAGATSRETCMKVMFKVHAPPECLEALESGKIDPKNEHQARKACEDIMFNLEAPEECKEAGLRDFRECERYMFKLDAPEECIEAGLTGSGRDDRKKCEIIRFKLDAPEECIEAGITGETRDDWKKCEVIKFKMDSPKECIDAGLTGQGRDDWKKCDAIRFRLDAPQECLDAGITGDNRDDWRKCEAIKFKSEAHPDCLAAGLDGSGRNDWRECQKIQFKAEAPKECIDAGLDGSGRRDWDECNKIREKSDGDHGQRREDCNSNQLHICDDNGYDCKCIDKDDYDKGTRGDDDDDDGHEQVCCSEPGPADGAEYRWKSKSQCQSPEGVEFPTQIVSNSFCEEKKVEGCGDCSAQCPGASSTHCEDDQCKCIYKQEVSECSDGCSQECGDQRTDCVDDKCVCLGYGEGGSPPGGSEGGTEGSTEGSEGSNDESKSSGTESTDSGSSAESESEGSSESSNTESSSGDAVTGSVVSDVPPSKLREFLKNFFK